MLDDVFHGLVLVAQLQQFLLVIQNVRNPNFIISWLSFEKAVNIPVSRIVNFDGRYIPLLFNHIVLSYLLFFESQWGSVHILDEILVNLTWRMHIGDHTLIWRNKNPHTFLKNVGAQNYLGRTNVAPNLIKLLLECHSIAIRTLIARIFRNRVALKMWFVQRFLSLVAWLITMTPA